MTDDELKSVLAASAAPEPPDGLSERIWSAFQERRRPWWRRLMSCRVTLPVPAAAIAAVVMLALGTFTGIAYRTLTEPRAVIQTRTAPPPVIQQREADPRTVAPVPRPVPAKAVRVATLTVAGFEPVAEIKPQVIRRN